MRPSAVHIVLLVLTLTLSACGSVLSKGKLVANGAAEVGDNAAEMLRVECTEEYSAAVAIASTEDGKKAARELLAKLDAKCLPMRDAVRTLRVAHIALVSAINVAEATKDESKLLGAVLNAAAALKAVGELVQAFEGGVQ